MQVGPYAMAARSRAVIESLDCKALSECRRANYRRLLEAPGVWALFPEIDDGWMPLGFPVLHDRAVAQANVAAAALKPPGNLRAMTNNPCRSVEYLGYRRAQERLRL